MVKHLKNPVLLALILGGCSQMPTYERPAVPIPSAWSNTTQRGAKQVSGENYFPDPRLQALIKIALENNRDLRIATARIAEAHALYGIQVADRYPNVNLNTSGTASLIPASVSATGSALRSNRVDVNASLVSFELDFWGRVSSLNASAKASYLATESAQRAFRLSLIADVANAYLSVLELRERTQLTVETLQGRESIRQLISRRRDAGISNDLDYLQAEGAYQAALAERANLERQQAAAENQLDFLLGASVKEIKNLPAARTLAEQSIVSNSLGDMPAEVLLQRPDVLAAEQKLIAANANIGAARAAFFPRISLTSAVGTASRSLSGLFDADSGAWSFQPTLSLPLFDAGRTAANVDVATARKNIAVAEYEKSIQQAFREVADLLAAREKLNEQLTAQQANADLQAQRLRLVDARYKAGVANYIEVLDAQRELYAAQQSTLQIRRTVYTSATQLYKALASEAMSDGTQ
ncbi:MAG: efflux transporter outer membrane subunit [Gallionella sp.]|nr:efflux transporter outer membrane subunit [Gallionella sp.]